MALDPARATLLAFRIFSRAPESLSRGLMRLAADVAWLRHGGGVRMADFGAQRVAEGRQPLRRTDRPQLDLRPNSGGIHGSNRSAELSRFGGRHKSGR